MFRSRRSAHRSATWSETSTLNCLSEPETGSKLLLPLLVKRSQPRLGWPFCTPIERYTKRAAQGQHTGTWNLGYSPLIDMRIVYKVRRYLSDAHPAADIRFVSGDTAEHIDGLMLPAPPGSQFGAESAF